MIFGLNNQKNILHKGFYFNKREICKLDVNKLEITMIVVNDL